MGSAKFTPFGLCVKKRLLDLGKSQQWLESEIREHTGLFIDAGYMYKILTGQRKAPKIVNSICDIIDLPPQDQSITVDVR